MFLTTRLLVKSRKILRITMNLDKFLSRDGEFNISAAEAQSLNADLARRSLENIPMSGRGQVTDYLLAALAVGSVEHGIRPALEKLLSELQAPG